jgi:hypothetical protein
MSELVRLSDHRRKPARVFFNRTELNQLLSLYSRRVMSGEWRDYAIDHGPGHASFHIFRHTAERPAYSVTKVTVKGRGVRFRLTAGPRTLKQGQGIEEVLKALGGQPRLVWPTF